MAKHLTYVQQVFGDPTTRPVRARSVEPAFTIPDEKKFEHTWIMAGSGAGKTSLLFREILVNLRRPDPPAMVILDPKGRIMPQLTRLKYFDDNDRLVIIDPSDIEYPPALNLFAPVPDKRFRMYSKGVQAQVHNQTIGLFSYIFGSRGQKLTSKQATCFEYLARLMFLIDGATIDTLLEVLNRKTSPEKWQPFIGRMDQRAQRWFREQYFDAATYVTTRDEIAQRLYAVTLRTDCFSTPERKIDMFELLQQRKTIIVNIPLALLDAAGVELFGRYIIALTLSAAFERTAIPEEEWTPAFLFLDEAHEFADEVKMGQLLHLAREFKLGVYFVNQDKGQITEALSSALGGSTSIKYVSKLGAQDIPMMAREMRCKQEDLAAIESTKHEGRFLCYVSGETPKPVLVTFPFGEMRNQPTMSREAHARLIARNRARVSATRYSETESPVDEPPRAVDPREAW